MEKFCLIIDNDDQSASIETIEREAKRKRIKIVCEQFNVGSSQEVSVLTDNKIDLAKVEQEFKRRFKNQTFDLIAFDWDLNDADVNGVDLIRFFENNRIRRSTPKFLYSGELKVQMESLLEQYKVEVISFKKAWDQIKTLIEIDIVDFKDREEYEVAIVNILEKENINLETLLLKELRNHPDIKFRGQFEVFEGKSFYEIAEVIENDKDLGISFKAQLIEEAITYLAELKDYENE